MRLSKVIDLDKEQEENLSRAFNGDIELGDARELSRGVGGIIKNRGLDVAPLRAWVREVVERGEGEEPDVELFVSTVSLSDRKALEIKGERPAGGRDMRHAAGKRRYHPKLQA